MKTINCFLTEHRTCKMPFSLSNTDYEKVINGTDITTIEGFMNEACNWIDNTDNVQFTCCIEKPNYKTPIDIQKLKNICNELRQFLDSANWPEDSDEDYDDNDYELEETLETLQSAWEEATNILKNY